MMMMFAGLDRQCARVKYVSMCISEVCVGGAEAAVVLRNTRPVLQEGATVVST